MERMQVATDTAARLGRAVADAWGEGASLEPLRPERDEVSPEPSAALRVGDGTVWLAGDLPPDLLQAAARACGGGVLPGPPAVDPEAVSVSFRWTRAGSEGRLVVAAPPGIWEAVAAVSDLAVEGEADAAPAYLFPPLAGEGGSGRAQSIDLLLDVPLELTVELGRTEKQIREILALSAGAIVQLDRLAGEPVDVLVNGRLVARGEVVVIDESFGVRITDILSPAERLSRLG